MFNKINKINKINKKIIASSIGIFFMYKFYKYMASIEYINSLSNQYEYIYRLKDNSGKNKEETSGKNESFVIVDKSIENTKEEDKEEDKKEDKKEDKEEDNADIYEGNYIIAGNYLHDLGK